MSTAPSAGSELRIGECDIASPQAARVELITRKAESGMSFFIGVLKKMTIPARRPAYQERIQLVNRKPWQEATDLC